MAKTVGKHLRFYIDCMPSGLMPYNGLCRCGLYNVIDDKILNYYFTPENFSDAITFWASGLKGDFPYHFTPLRQTIVLLMACLNDEL